MNWRDRVQEYLADRFSSVQYPRLTRVASTKRAPRPTVDAVAARLLLGVVSGLLGVVGAIGVVWGLGLIGWLLWAMFFN
jgi:hypothetical protein